MAVKVMIRRRVPAGRAKSAGDLLTELRMLANAQAGYVSGETLRNYEDSEEVLVISTWQTPEAWTKWFTDRRRQEVQARVDELLGSRTTYTVYHH